MISILIDGLVLLGLMYIIDRNNPYRDFLETGAVAFVLVVAEFILGKFLLPRFAILVLAVYFVLCVLLLWKFIGMSIHKALLIGSVFILFKVAEPFIFRLVLGTEPEPSAAATTLQIPPNHGYPWSSQYPPGRVSVNVIDTRYFVSL